MEGNAVTPAAAPRPSLVPTGLIGLAFLVVAIVFCTSSNWYYTFKAVHVAFAVIWLGGGFMLTVLGIIAERENDAEGLAAVARQAALVGDRLFSPSSGIVLAAGIAMMINPNWGWNHFWVVAGLVGFASTFVTGVFVLSPRSRRLEEVMHTAGPTSPQAQAAIKQILLIARFDVAVLFLVVVDMVVKPFA